MKLFLASPDPGQETCDRSIKFCLQHHHHLTCSQSTRRNVWPVQRLRHISDWRTVTRQVTGKG